MSNGLLTAISSLVAILVAIGSLYISLKKAPAEKANTEADTMGKYQAIADAAAERALKLDKRVIELEEKTDAQESEINELKAENARLRAENSDLRGWAERLVHQLQSHSIKPVELVIRTYE